MQDEQHQAEDGKLEAALPDAFDEACHARSSSQNTARGVGAHRASASRGLLQIALLDLPAMQRLLEIVRATLIESRFYRFPELAVAGVLIGIVAALFVKELALTEAAELGTLVLAGILRTIAVLITILLVTTAVVRDFEDNTIAIALSAPLPRWLYLIGRTCGFLILSSLLALLYALGLLVISRSGAVVPWGVSLALELGIVALFAQLFALTFRQVSGAAVAALLFYLFARVLGAVSAIFSNSLSIDRDAFSTQFFDTVLTGLSWITPDLGRFTQGAWLSGSSSGWSLLGSLTLEAIIYGALLVCVALLDLYRRELL
jgi:ABC-type transport system involved in multi-copper enzyme maturation permease subunit